MKILWSPLAIERMTQVAEYIANDNPTASEKWIDSVFKKVEQLEKFPKLGRIVPEANRNEIREILYKNYRVIYRLDKNYISILTVRHGKQILPEKELTV